MSNKMTQALEPNSVELCQYASHDAIIAYAAISQAISLKRIADALGISSEQKTYTKDTSIMDVENTFLKG